MKKIVFILIAFLAIAKVNSQMLDPVKWTTKIEKSENTFVLIFDAVLEKIGTCIPIHSDGGPLQLEVSFKNKGNFNLVGRLRKVKRELLT
jgi:thiol:disulfide interchange protein DsbD